MFIPKIIRNNFGKIKRENVKFKVKLKMTLVESYSALKKVTFYYSQSRVEKLENKIRV